MASQPTNPKTNQPFRPEHLPPPTILPLRHCAHNEDSIPIDEHECLLSLFAPSADAKKNKEHYILATADPPAPDKVAANTQGDGKKRKRAETEAEEAVRRAKMLRNGARAIPGVPIVYVKRSVMVLEPMSRPSEGVRDGFEQGKFRVGLDESALGKRKRDGEGGGEEKKKRAGPEKKAKGPNPLSMRKPKKRDDQDPPTQRKKEGRKEDEKTAQGGDEPERKEGDSSALKPKRRRRHHKGVKEGDGDGDGDGANDPKPSNGPDEPTAPMDLE